MTVLANARSTSRPRTLLRRRRGVGDRTLAALFVLPSVVLIALFAVYPLGRAIADSFFIVDAATGHRTFTGLSNYRAIFTDASVRAAFVRTLIWVVGNVVVEVPVGIAIALLLHQRIRGRTLARGLVLFPYMVPAIVLALVFQFLLNDVTGLVNYLLQSAHITNRPLNFLGDPHTVLVTMVLVNAWKFTPFVVIVVLARLQTLPPELIEAAAIDGAGRIALYRAVLFPWIRGVVILAVMLRTIWSAYEYDVPYLLAQGGPLGSSTTVPIEIKTLAFDHQELGAASALAVLMAVVLFAAGSVLIGAFRRNAARM